MKIIFLSLLLSFQLAHAGRIRNHKVKEAPRSCKIMQEDQKLTRKNKRVMGTLRNSLLIEDDSTGQTVTLVKDKGEKICQWSLEKWLDIQKQNNLPELASFKFYIDEYKDVMYPYVQKDDKSYFVMRIPTDTCDMSEQKTVAQLQLPKCVTPKKSKRSSRRRKSVAKS